jgi:hypothetical protein
MLEITGPAPESDWESSAVTSEARSARRKKRALFRRAGLIPPALGIACVLVAIVYLASYVTAANGSGAASMFGAIDGLGHSGSVAALAQERTLIIEMDAAAKTLSIASKPVMANPSSILAAQSAGETSGGTGIVTEAAPADPTSAEATGKAELVSFGFNDTTEWTCLYNLWQRESGWNVYAENASGAYGIPQSLPGNKMASSGTDWQTNPSTQINWGLGYIKSVYGTPCGAWDHEVADGFY